MDKEKTAAEVSNKAEDDIDALIAMLDAKMSGGAGHVDVFSDEENDVKVTENRSGKCTLCMIPNLNFDKD